MFENSNAPRISSSFDWFSLERMTRQIPDAFLAGIPMDVETYEEIVETFTEPPPPVNETETTFFFGLISEKRRHNIEVAMMYVLHALTYTQSAFNWLFYSFLNRNLRGNTSRGNGTRSGVNTSVFDNGAATSTVNTSLTPIWKNIQQMGSHIKTAGLDTRTALMKKSPFKGKSKIQSR